MERNDRGRGALRAADRQPRRRRRRCCPSTPARSPASSSTARRSIGDAERLSTRTSMIAGPDDARPTTTRRDETREAVGRRRRAARRRRPDLPRQPRRGAPARGDRRGTRCWSTPRASRSARSTAWRSCSSAATASAGPSRITARVRMGKGEVVDIEREVELGGPIHSKGVMILAGVPRRALRRRAAAGARGEPGLRAVLRRRRRRQRLRRRSCMRCSRPSPRCRSARSLAVTGSVNQHGEVQAIGGVNEKIEGFFDVCAGRGLTGEQGVLIPAANVKHLMLCRRRGGRRARRAASTSGRWRRWTRPPRC